MSKKPRVSMELHSIELHTALESYCADPDRNCSLNSAINVAIYHFLHSQSPHLLVNVPPVTLSVKTPGGRPRGTTTRHQLTVIKGMLQEQKEEMDRQLAGLGVRAGVGITALPPVAVPMQVLQPQYNVPRVDGKAKKTRKQAAVVKVQAGVDNNAWLTEPPQGVRSELGAAGVMPLMEVGVEVSQTGQLESFPMPDYEMAVAIIEQNGEGVVPVGELRVVTREELMAVFSGKPGLMKIKHALWMDEVGNYYDKDLSIWRFYGNGLTGEWESCDKNPGVALTEAVDSGKWLPDGNLGSEYWQWVEMSGMYKKALYHQDTGELIDEVRPGLSGGWLVNGMTPREFIVSKF